MDLSNLKITEHKQPRLKVKLTVRGYTTKSGYELKKSLYFYKNPNPEHLVDAFYEHADSVGIYSINNLHLLDSGIYEMIVTNINIDRETGWIDDYDYELIPWRD